MPEFVYQWLKILIYYLDLFLGNIGFVQYLKRFVYKPTSISYLYPILILIGFIIVVILIFYLNFFSSEKRVIKRRKK